ncbi:magnesium transporter [Entomortierella parvispora]|uniref:Magnesium transporter n=1 Tax=Entomortierella parvispora TaxID=205924 RepID=A0A9P3HIG2_9FUNG|nr:magnesium transporter [Entomortierella parvispora]
MWPMDDFPDINVHSYIGVIIAIAGNILISVALNIQKYAHNQLQPSSQEDAKLPPPTAYPFTIEEEDVISHHRHGRGRPTTAVASRYPETSDDNLSYPSSRSSSRSSIRSCHSNYNSDTSEQSETLSPAPHRSGEDECDSVQSGSDTDYLRSKAWWVGMILMILGECGNFLAYGYAQASIIAPLGTVALVSNVILAPLMLREPFRSRDLFGVVIAIIGTVVVVINSKESEIKLTPEAMTAALLQTQFIVYFIVCSVLVAVLASLSETIGSQYIFIDLSIVAIFGGYTVLSTKGVSSLLSLSFYKMFTYPIAYLLVFVLVTTAVLQIKYLNKSLQRFDSTQVIPTQFVLFTTSAIVGSAILYNDFDEMDFNKGLNFLTGCCMTFLGVYFITSHRDKDGLVAPAVADAEWIMAAQQRHATNAYHRASIDTYASNRPLYPQDHGRPDHLMEQGRSSLQNLGVIISPNPNHRPIRSSVVIPSEYSSSHNASTPLLGTSSKQPPAMPGPTPGPKDPAFSITNSVHNVLAAVGARHTSALGLDKVVENYLVQKNEERRGSIQSLNQQQFSLQRPGLGSRSSSACSGALPPPSLTTHPSSSSLFVPSDMNYGSSFQTHHSAQTAGTSPLTPFVRPNNGPTFDPRFQAPHLQERSLSQDSTFQKQPRPKTSMPHLTKEQQKEHHQHLNQRELKEGPSTRAQPKGSAGVAVPSTRRGDRQTFPSPSEHEFIVGMSRSVDSEASSTPKARFLPGGALLSSSPQTKYGAGQGSEYAIQTLHKSPPQHHPLNQGSGNTAASSTIDPLNPAAQLPPLPTSSQSTMDPNSQGRRKTPHQPSGSVDSSFSSSQSGFPLLTPGKRAGGHSKAEGDGSGGGGQQQ